MEIVGYPSTFYPVFVNLVDNAIFWLKDRPERRITLDLRDGRILVSDTGPGIPKRDRDSVFELGFSRKPGGRGMGLYIARAVLARADYELTIADSDTGTTFVIKSKQEKSAWSHLRCAVRGQAPGEASTSCRGRLFCTLSTRYIE